MVGEKSQFEPTFKDKTRKGCCSQVKEDRPIQKRMNRIEFCFRELHYGNEIQTNDRGSCVLGVKPSIVSVAPLLLSVIIVYALLTLSPPTIPIPLGIVKTRMYLLISLSWWTCASCIDSHKSLLLSPKEAIFGLKVDKKERRGTIRGKRLLPAFHSFFQF